MNRREPDGDPQFDAPESGVTLDVERIVRLVAALNRPQPSDAKRIMAVIGAVGAALLAAFVTGIWALQGDFREFRGQVTEWQKSGVEWQRAVNERLERLERKP